jgi:hypothetical protein
MNKVSLLVAGACTLHAAAHGQILEERAASRHHFGFGAPTWIRARANFTATRATNPGPAPTTPVPTLADGRVNRTYEDGYNLVNSAGNPVLGGESRTSFYGFQDGVQLQPTAGSGTVSVAMHSVTLNGGDYTRKLDNQPFPGLEAFYRYDWKAGKDWLLSWELAAAYHFFHWEMNGAPGSSVNLLTDTFALGGVDFTGEPIPFNGTFAPVVGRPNIGSTPTRTEGTAAASVAGRRQLDLHALQLRVGPSLTWEPGPKWHFGLQAGLALGTGFSQLRFAEQITVAAPATPVLSQSGGSSATHLWAGLFSSVRVIRRLRKDWEAHVEVRHLLTDTLRHNGPTRSGEIRLSDGLGISTGLSYRF